MINFLRISTIAVALFFPAFSVDASSGRGQQPHARTFEVPGHDPIGKPSDGSSIDRMIEVFIRETESGYMLFEPDAIQIERGSVVRFAISNAGALDHEFFLGSFDEVAEHQQWMREHPDMQHDSANSVSIPSGQNAELTWEFSDMTNLEFVCLIPGHREAGMWGVIIVHDHLAPKSKG
ncbi:plastocyanin/azurin family copper-binding protein [uncultured Sulfitobacter sp.]|uniref:cupredoxin domain-containing protein n=1 Tax=uncultured Sulfitobacter sp. TaxID=191468 RepID=UPI00262AA6F9|nr:plastocyanin/azurin family copper-binding protein [uncultured Sulfitobacter sp.]